MQKPLRTAKETAESLSLLLAGLGLAAVLLLASCPAGSSGSQGSPGNGQPRGQGTSASQPTTTGTAASPAATLSRSIERELPLDGSFVIDSVSKLPGDHYSIEAISSQDALKTSTLLITRLQQLGYETDDNASRILEGASYSKPDGKIRDLHVRVSLGTDGKCRVFLETR